MLTRTSQRYGFVLVVLIEGGDKMRSAIEVGVGIGLSFRRQ